MICTLKNTVTDEYLHSAVIKDGFLHPEWRKETSDNTAILFIMDEPTAKRYQAHLEAQGIHTTIMAMGALLTISTYQIVQACRVFATLALIAITAILACK